MYDYARAGWDVVAVCADAVQSNALLVLGVTPVDLDAVSKREPGPGMDRWPSAHTFNTHRAILGVLSGVSRNPLLDVQVFRSVPPGSRSAASGQMHHRLSTAAQALSGTPYAPFGSRSRSSIRPRRFVSGRSRLCNTRMGFDRLRHRRLESCRTDVARAAGAMGGPVDISNAMLFLGILRVALYDGLSMTVEAESALK